MVIFGKLAKLLLCYKRYVLIHPGLHLPCRRACGLGLGLTCAPRWPLRLITDDRVSDTGADDAVSCTVL